MLQNLPKVRGEYRENFTLASLTWFKVGGPAKLLFKPYDFDDLSLFLSSIPEDVELFVLGAGSNILIRDGGVNGIVVKLGRNFANIELLPGNKIKVGAGCLNYNLSQFCYQNSIKGFEFLLGIPGTIGGGIKMNAGAYSREFKDIISSIEVIDRSGKIYSIANSEIGFSYRKNSLPEGLIFLTATFNYELGDRDSIKNLMDEIMQRRLDSQPVKEKTCGSTFTNPTNSSCGKKVWQLIDEAGMRGARIGDAEMSNLHCNFMINKGHATAKDLEDLGEMVRSKVFEKTGVQLEWEIQRKGEFCND
ncbi:MAG: UDP-N-acetylmuramate dehydrogenase [Rickettsiaceae bacterium]|nr:UDP-N-acetylmuramate dehydrogenase [Rickettsiaceae bacterium]